MKTIKTSQGTFTAPEWVSKATNKRQIELVALAWKIKFQNELNATRNRAYALRKKIIGK